MKKYSILFSKAHQQDVFGANASSALRGYLLSEFKEIAMNEPAKGEFRIVNTYDDFATAKVNQTGSVIWAEASLAQ